MRLATADGYSLDLRIVGYQFPDLQTEDDDSNWLIVEGKLSHPRGSWKFRDPCLLTYEAARLSDWLDSIARGNPSSERMSFIEPNLSFEHVASPTGAHLRVYLELEARPSWAPSNVVDEQCWLDFPASAFELRRAAASLRDQLKKYPQRATR